jgi:hypothetical protein
MYLLDLAVGGWKSMVPQLRAGISPHLDQDAKANQTKLAENRPERSCRLGIATVDRRYGGQLAETNRDAGSHRPPRCRLVERYGVGVY